MTDLTPFPLDHAGAALVGQLALPDGPGPHPAVLVMSNAYGLGRQARDTAGRLAALGYAALATDMYGGGAYGQGEAAGPLIEPLWRDPALLRARAVAWADALAAHAAVDRKRMAAIGYCFGGQCVLEIARAGTDLALVVSYHGILKTVAPARPGAVRPLVAVMTGARDPYAPPEDVAAFRAEMAAAGARWHLTEYGDAAHGFTDREAREPDKGIAYEPVAAAASWAATVALLEQAVRR